MRRPFTSSVSGTSAFLKQKLAGRNRCPDLYRRLCAVWFASTRQAVSFTKRPFNRRLRQRQCRPGHRHGKSALKNDFDIAKFLSSSVFCCQERKQRSFSSSWDLPSYTYQEQGHGTGARHLKIDGELRTTCVRTSSERGAPGSCQLQ